MVAHVIETRYCGSLKLEIVCHGNFATDPTLFSYSVRGFLGKAPVSVEGPVELNLDNINPIGREALIKVCNEFITKLNKKCELAGDQGTIPVLMNANILKVQIHNLLCQNVEGILQADQPQWLITEREV